MLDHLPRPSLPPPFHFSASLFKLSYVICLCESDVRGFLAGRIIHFTPTFEMFFNKVCTRSWESNVNPRRRPTHTPKRKTTHVTNRNAFSQVVKQIRGNFRGWLFTRMFYLKSDYTYTSVWGRTRACTFYPKIQFIKQKNQLNVVVYVCGWDIRLFRNV